MDCQVWACFTSPLDSLSSQNLITRALGMFSSFSFFCVSRTAHLVALIWICQHRCGFQPRCDVLHEKSHGTFKSLVMYSDQYSFCDVLFITLHNAHKTSFKLHWLFDKLYCLLHYNFSNSPWLQHICSFFALWCPGWSIIQTWIYNVFKNPGLKWGRKQIIEFNLNLRNCN